MTYLEKLPAVLEHPFELPDDRRVDVRAGARGDPDCRPLVPTCPTGSTRDPETMQYGMIGYPGQPPNGIEETMQYA